MTNSCTHSLSSSSTREKNNYYESLLIQDLPKRQKTRPKIPKEDFQMLEFSDYDKLMDNDYNLSQLKLINKNYKQKISGNKMQLLTRIYNYLKYSSKTVLIQKLWRGHLQRRVNALRGPAFMRRSLSINDDDFFTLETVNEIPRLQFISLKDADDFVYSFNIISLYNIFMKTKNPENPYTKKKLDNGLLENLRKLIKISRLLKDTIETRINEDEEELSSTKNFSMRVLSLFQFIDSLGNYTQMNWFINLNKAGLIRFVRELYDIWNYRAQLSEDIKREICPPIGNPFINFNVNIIANISFTTLQKSVFNLMENLVKSGINNDSKTLGAYYVLCALTLVSPDAAEAMPVLYQSVMPLN
jgi:hypothetical protein